MSLEKLDVTNAQGNLLTLELEDTSNGYVVEDIDGLGPVNASIATSDFAALDGVQYQDSSRGARNIVIKLSYDPDYDADETVWQLRSGLYQYFMPKSKVTLKFYMGDGLEVTTEGRVESCEPSIFTAEPQMDISVICFDPDFVDLDPVAITGLTTTDTVGHAVTVDGNIEVGLTSLSFVAPKALSDFTIYHTAPSGEVTTMQVAAPLLLNDVVTLCTIKGKKSITLTRSGVTTSLTWAVSPQSVWTLLKPGLNQLYLNASLTTPAPVTATFNNRYGGL